MVVSAEYAHAMTVAGQLASSAQAVADAPRRPPLPRLVYVATAFALGIALGDLSESVWLWLAVAAILALSAGLAAARPRLGLLCVIVASMCLGGAWVNYRLNLLAVNDLATVIGEESTMVRIEGIATGTPEFRRRTGGSLAVFDYRQPSTYFPMRVETVLTREGEPTSLRGRVFVKVDAAVAPFRAGDRVRLTGHLVPMRPPLNPGEFDRQAYARALGQAGMVVVPDRRLVDVTPASRGALYSAWLDFRDNVRRRASGQLLSDLPPAESSNRDALLKALLLGQREPDLDGLNESFRRVGLAHLMAISGLHLGILAGLVLLVVRFTGHYRPWHGWLVIAVVLAYLTLIEVRLPVMRAGIMTIAACAGLAMGRYLQVGGLIALSGIALLLWRPDQLFSPGFQLSFGVVLGLIYLQPIVRQRWFGKSDLEAASSAQMAGQWLMTAFVTAVVAWLIATPIVVHHFGIVSPFGIVLSVVGVPVIALILALGYAKMILAMALPSVALMLGIPLAIATDVMITVVVGIDSLPLASWNVPFASAAWVFVALAFVVYWARGIRWQATVAGVVVLLIWLYWPWLPARQQPAMRVDMFAVGDGTCIVLRSGGQTFVFDAGSNSSLDAGRRWIVPAMRRSNIRRIDAIAISHPDIDHYSAVLELVDEFSVNRVLVTPQFIEHAQLDPDGPVARVTDALAQRRVAVQVVTAGHEQQLGHATLRWFYPLEGGERFRRDNEQSMVVRVDVADRRLLLTGDLEGAGMAYLLPRVNDLRSDIVELPHHGSYNDLAAAFIAAIEPSIVLQSTGFSRWRRDRWADDLAGVQRYVTVRDGAVWVEIAPDGTITSSSFIE